MVGSYVARGELLVYPFFEHTVQSLEYKPAELVYGLDQDFRGRYRDTEALLLQRGSQGHGGELRRDSDVRTGQL